MLFVVVAAASMAAIHWTRSYALRTQINLSIYAIIFINLISIINSPMNFSFFFAVSFHSRFTLIQFRRLVVSMNGHMRMRMRNISNS